MSKRKKLIQFIKDHPHKVRFDDLIQLLLYFGFEMRMKGTSHATFKKEGSAAVTIPRPHGKEAYVQEVYVKEAIRAIENSGI